jgi:hypothetical protein
MELIRSHNGRASNDIHEDFQLVLWVTSNISAHRLAIAPSRSFLQCISVPVPMQIPIRRTQFFELREATFFRKRILDLDADLRHRPKRAQEHVIMIPVKALVQECRGSPRVAVGLMRQ